LVEEHLQSGQLCRVLADIPTHPKRKGIYALYSEQRLLSPKARVFIDFLKEKFLLERWNKVSHIE
jgi:DNA-binding transcriptional LysR family regulator